MPTARQQVETQKHGAPNTGPSTCRPRTSRSVGRPRTASAREPGLPVGIEASLMFRSIRLEGWRQFRDVQLSFHDRLTVLTGANGAGKTTILNLLNRHFGWNLSFISTPRRKRELVEHFSGYWRGETPEEELAPHGQQAIGEIVYRDGAVAGLSVPESVTEGVPGQCQRTAVNRRSVCGITSSCLLLSEGDNDPHGAVRSRATPQHLRERNQDSIQLGWSCQFPESSVEGGFDLAGDVRLRKRRRRAES